MKRYVDYCPNCPTPMVEVNHVTRQGPPRPDLCRCCSPKDYEDHIRQYHDVLHRIKKQEAKVREAQRAIRFYTKKRDHFHRVLQAEYGNCGKLRVINLCGVVAIMDYREGKLKISFSELERL